MRSFGIIAKRVHQARNLILRDNTSDLFNWSTNRLALLGGGVQPDVVTLTELLCVNNLFGLGRH